MTDRCDIAVDFMDMTDDRRMWARPVDARPGLEMAVGRHLIVGDDEADPRIAQIITIDADGNVELMVLVGPVESHQDLLSRAYDPGQSASRAQLDGSVSFRRWAHERRATTSGEPDGPHDRRTSMRIVVAEDMAVHRTPARALCSGGSMPPSEAGPQEVARCGDASLRTRTGS